MNRRTLISSMVAAGIVVILPEMAESGKGWCRVDPSAIVNGQEIAFYGDVNTDPHTDLFVAYELHGPPDTFEVTSGPCPVSVWVASSTFLRFYQENGMGDSKMRLQVKPIGGHGPIGAVSWQGFGTPLGGGFYVDVPLGGVPST